MKKYSPNMALKYRFPGLESITTNYSQTFQDMFVLTMLNGKRNGIFLEIGGFDPFDISNTCLLEKDFGWTGISIEIDGWRAANIKRSRTCTVINDDALKIDYQKELASYPRRFDYLQIDIDDASLNCLMKLPMDTYRFSVITFEHDARSGGHHCYMRQASRKIFGELGYVMIAGNISNQSHEDIYEDWWVDPAAVDASLISMFKRDGEVNMPGDELLAA